MHAPTAPKAQKSNKKHKNTTKQKHKNQNKGTKIKYAPKKHLRAENHLFAYLRFCACEEKCWSHLTSKSTFCSIQAKTSLLEPVKKLNCLNDSGATKLVKVCTAIRTKISLVAPVKKLNCFYEIS